MCFEELQDAYGDSAPVTTKLAIELQEKAWALQDAGALDEAADVCTRALRLIERTEGPDSADAANLLNDLSAIEYERLKLHYALQRAQSAKRISDQWNCLTNDTTLTRIRGKTLELIGNLHRVFGNYESAEVVLLEAARNAEDAFGVNSHDLACAKNNLGVLYKFWGRFDDGLELYREALGCYETGSLESAQILHNIGGILHAAGNASAGEQPAREAWLITKSVLGAESNEAMLDAMAYAAILDDLGEFEEAEDLYLAGLQFFETRCGSGHYETAAIRHNLAGHRAAQGRFEEAEQNYRSALKTKIDLIGPDCPDVAITEQNLGALLHKLGRSDEGRDLLQRAVSILAVRLKPNHPILLHAISTLQEMT